LASADISTQAGAQSVIATITDFSQSVSSQRSDTIGTSYARLTSIDEGIATQLEAERASLARLSDADIASESAKLVQNTIRMQIGAALLGKDSANQTGVILNLLA
jgi:flagellin